MYGWQKVIMRLLGMVSSVIPVLRKQMWRYKEDNSLLNGILGRNLESDSGQGYFLKALRGPERQRSKILEHV